MSIRTNRSEIGADDRENGGGGDRQKNDSNDDAILNEKNSNSLHIHCVCV